MPSTSSQLDSAALAPAAGAAVGPRVSVLDIFQRHIGALSRLPGEISQFEETGVGYEWRCQMDLGTCPSGQALRDVPCTLQLQFSLIDLDGRSQPVAVLYLVEQACGSAWQERALMSLSDPQALHEQIDASLLPLTPDTEVLDKAALFVGALVVAKAAIGSEVDWV